MFLKGIHITAVCRIEESLFRVNLALKTTEKNGMASSIVSDLLRQYTDISAVTWDFVHVYLCVCMVRFTSKLMKFKLQSPSLARSPFKALVRSIAVP